jgi:tRNA G18 (ribose-2'-O)-methylase SpoU
MRGYFGIGAQGISKPMNLGALMRTANAFGASFVFSVDADTRIREAYKADTSRSAGHVPYYQWDAITQMSLPQDCRLVGIELTPDAVELPRFRHPRAAAYVLGPEKGDLSAEMLARCEHVVKIPTRFCINVSLAGALVMYDRMISLGGYGPRPLMPGGPADGNDQ